MSEEVNNKHLSNLEDLIVASIGFIDLARAALGSLHAVDDGPILRAATLALTSLPDLFTEYQITGKADPKIGTLYNDLMLRVCSEDLLCAKRMSLCRIIIPSFPFHEELSVLVTSETPIAMHVLAKGEVSPST